MNEHELVDLEDGTKIIVAADQNHVTLTYGSVIKITRKDALFLISYLTRVMALTE